MEYVFENTTTNKNRVQYFNAYITNSFYSNIEHEKIYKRKYLIHLFRLEELFFRFILPLINEPNKTITIF